MAVGAEYHLLLGGEGVGLRLGSGKEAEVGIEGFVDGIAAAAPPQ